MKFPLLVLAIGAVFNAPLYAQQAADSARAHAADSAGHRAPLTAGAQSRVDAGQFNSGLIVNPLLLIEDHVAGVQIIDNNQLGGILSIRIRGQASVNLENEPLYVLDGTPLGDGAGGGISDGRDPLNFLNPSDIASITVLRDPAAAAMYGGNASNGVVLIATKWGEGRPTVEYGGSFSSASVTRLPSVLNAAQFRTAVNQYATGQDTLLGSATTDWYTLVDRIGASQQHNVSMSGGGPSNGYRLSLGFLDAGSILQSSSTQRISLGINYAQRLYHDRLDVRLSLRGARSNDQFTPAGVLDNAALMGPTQPVLDPTSATGYYNWPGNNLVSADNPVEVLRSAIDHGTTDRSVGNVRATYDFSAVPALSGLAATVSLGYDVARSDRVIFYPNNIHIETKDGADGSFYENQPTQTSRLLEGYLEYRPVGLAGPGRLDLRGGYSSSRADGRDYSISAYQLATNLLGDAGIPQTATPPIPSVYVQDSKLTSFFGRVAYDVDDRYLVEGSIRHDVSSRFAPGNRGASFPAFSFAWRASDEPFLRGVRALTDLKLRASWGRTGNQSFGDYLSLLSSYACGLNCPFPMVSVGPNITWEVTGTWDLGLDYGLWGDRLSGAIDWYTRRTDNLISTVAVPLGPGIGNYYAANVGSLRNTGVELELIAHLLNRAPAGGLSWTTSLTASHNNNKLLSLSPVTGGPLLTGAIAGGVGSTVQVLEAGQPLNSFYVCRQVYSNGKPVENQYYNLAGDSIMAGCFRGENARPFHDPAPRWMLGLTSALTFRRFDLSFTLRAWVGNYVYNNAAADLGNYALLAEGSAPYNLSTSVLKTGFVSQQLLSDYYVEDGSFLRMDNISVGYTVPWQGQRLRLYAIVQNAFTITGYSGVDPGAQLSGIDNLTYPQSRIFTGGLTVQF